MTTAVNTPSNTPPTIVLAMIVRNEEKIIIDLLKSVAHFVDYYCIHDTGSADNTKEIMREYFESAGFAKKYKITDSVWKDFGTNRTLCLNDAKQFGNYMIMLDADDIFISPPNTRDILQPILTELKPAGINFTIQIGNIETSRTQLFKSDCHWKYIGVLHEYPIQTVFPAINAIILPEMRMFKIIGRTIGSRNRSHDIATLISGIENEPENGRYIFYLAQTYMDKGDLVNAEKWYKHHLNLPHSATWFEERYMSALKITRLTEDLSAKKEWAWKAHELDKRRIESLMEYVMAARHSNMFTQELFAIISYILTVATPYNVLFFEREMWDWRRYDEYLIIMHYTHNIQPKFVKYICDILREKMDLFIPLSEHSRISQNIFILEKD